MRQRLRQFGFPTALFALLLTLASQASATPLFDSREVLDITIEGPLSALISERSDDEYYDGRLSFPDADGGVKTVDLKFRTRGNFRRRESTCRFPPVRLNLPRKAVEGTVFDGQNILKLVTHCRPRTGRYEKYVLREELAYRILNLHTEASFRTRLLRITWINTDRDNEADTRYGFVIEHKNELEERLGMAEPGYERVRYARLNEQQATISALYEYMIGNTDFSMISAPEGESCCHNGILVEQTPDDLYFLPYDFDMAGIVDAPYASPNPRFRLRGVTDRLYRGHCRFNDRLDEVVALFKENRDAVLQLVDNQPGFEDRDRRQTRKFLEDFYDDIGSPKELTKNIIDACRGRAD